MNKKMYFLTAGLAMVLGLAGGLMLNKAQVMQPVQAQAAEESQKAARKWEHCSVLPVNGVSQSGGKVTGAAVISYVNGNGYRTEKVEATVDEGVNAMNLATSSALAKAVSRLGEGGWEMVGEGTLLPESSGGQRVLYFRRPKQ